MAQSDSHSLVITNHQELKEAVYRLLKYAVSDANKDVDDEIIKEAIPVLQQTSSVLTPQDEEKLWIVYNKLSLLVAPANNESLQFKEQLETEDRDHIKKGTERGLFYALFLRLFSKSPPISLAQEYRHTSASFILIGCIFGLFFFLMQSYTVTLSNSLKLVDQHYVELANIENQIISAKSAKPDIAICTSPFKELREKEEEVLLKIDGQYQVMQKLSKEVWGAFYAKETLRHYIEKPPLCTSKVGMTASYPSYLEQRARVERSTFFEGAKSTLQLCNYLILPLIMGTLGATAYVIRKLLDSFAEASLTFGPNRRGFVRVCLGALLGLISGVIISPDFKEIQQISYSPLVWSFLMGYNVEFAFGIFDVFIKRGRDALQAFKLSSSAQPKETVAKNKIPN
jgi:hypothetical protein